MTRPVVVKVGGSLLDWPGLPARLLNFLEGRRHERLVLVVGGGRFVDLVRELDVAHRLGEDRSHDLAMHAMDLTASVLVKVPVLATRRFLDADDRSAAPLPHAWSTTSDSIAARLAVRLGAGELVLLKSASLPPGRTLDGAAGLGLVDPEFPRASADLRRITYLNLRDPRGLVETQLSGTDLQAS
jgi:aspartokinase-like uncharacterized kinase